MFFKNLLGNKFKILISLLGVALTVFLILTMVGIYYSFSTMMDDLVDSTQADLWITSKGATGSLHSPSLLPIDLKSNISSIPEIIEVAPYIRTPIKIEIENQKELLYITGYVTNGSLGKPFNIVDGVDSVQIGEIIIDYSLANKYKLQIGDFFSIDKKDFKIVGISDGTNLMIAFIVFMSFEDATEYLRAGLTNFFLVKVSSEIRINFIKNVIYEKVEDISLQTNTEVAEDYKDEILGSFLPIFFILSLIGYIIGIFIIGLLVFSLTIEKRKEYGIMKALGATDVAIYKIVLGQSLFLSVSGFLLAVISINPIINLIRNFVPEFVVELNEYIIISILSSSVITGLLASLIPINSILNIDPALVFKEV